MISVRINHMHQFFYLFFHIGSTSSSQENMVTTMDAKTDPFCINYRDYWLLRPEC